MATSTTKPRAKSSKIKSKTTSARSPRSRAAQSSDVEAGTSKTKPPIGTRQSADDGNAAAKPAEPKTVKAEKAKDRIRAAKNAPACSDTELAVDPSSAEASTDNAADRAEKKHDANAKDKVNAPSAAPKGKLAALLEAISRDGGTSLAEISAALGWQHHTTRAAITRLRQRGYDIVLENVHGARCYQLRSEA